MKRLTMALLGMSLAWMACKPPPEPPPPEVTPEMQAAVERGFRKLVANFADCNDMKAFLECHTDQAQAGLKALNAVVNPVTLDQAATSAENKGAMWSCLLAKKAGLVPDKMKMKRLLIDPAVKTAKAIFEIDGFEFGFPLARQRNEWRSPFPGHVYLVNEYAVFANRIVDNLADEAMKATIQNQIKEAVKALEAYQPNWNEYPEVVSKEEDEAGMEYSR